MEKGIVQNKKAIGKLFLIIAIVIVAAVGGIAGGILLSQQGPSTSPSPSPTQTPQTTNPAQTTQAPQTENPQSTSSPTESSEPTETSATQTPTASQTPAPTQGASSSVFRTGAYANYLLTDYLTNSSGSTTTIKLSISGEETYSGTTCWVYIMTTESKQYGLDYKVVTTKWLSKTTLDCVHIRVQSYSNGELTSDDEYPGDSNEGSDMPNVTKPTVGTETKTVTAGTFNNCVKTEEPGPNGQIGSREWVSVDVPIWGLVKLETYLSGQPMSVYELTGYGG